MSAIFTALLALVMAWMSMLIPGRDHTEAATAIAEGVSLEAPLFKDDSSKIKTAALVTAISFRESSFQNKAKSKTNDHCLMQVNNRPDLADDATKCVRVAISMLRESMRMCPEHPIAFYASGPGACTNLRAQKISRDRMRIAKRLEQSKPESAVVAATP
jgi:hypothetical protein